MGMNINNDAPIKQAPQHNMGSVGVFTPNVEAPKSIRGVEKLPEEVSSKVTSEKEASELVEKLNKAITPLDTSLKFGFDSKSDDFYVSVINEKTSETIRRFPAEEATSLADKMYEITGVLFDKKG
jgi:flagellar protein FlaG